MNDLLFSQDRCRFLEQQTSHLQHAAFAESVEDDDLVQSIDKLRREVAPQFAVDELPHLLRLDGRTVRAEANTLSLDQLAPTRDWRS